MSIGRQMLNDHVARRLTVSKPQAGTYIVLPSANQRKGRPEPQSADRCRCCELRKQPEAEISFNLLHNHCTSLFENPLECGEHAPEATDHFKSIFRYGIAVTDLSAHVPTIKLRLKSGTPTRHVNTPTSFCTPTPLGRTNSRRTTSVMT